MSAALGRRIGYDRAQRLMTLLREEERLDGLGLRDEGQPSRALTELERAVMQSEFTPQERHRIRLAAGFDGAAEVAALIAEPKPDGSGSTP